MTRRAPFKAGLVALMIAPALAFAQDGGGSDAAATATLER